ncbi:hypothetical protein NA57DRAFT_38699, partial [Rhizodiscina lignyota]
ARTKLTLCSRDDSGGRASTDSYRQRSPGPYERRGRGNRNRSRSPPNIDRYQPGRASRDDDYRFRHELHHRRRSSPRPPNDIDRYVPGQESNPPPITVNPLANPLTLDYQVGFNFFAEWWRVDQRIKEEKERAKNGGRRPTVKDEREERGRERERIQEAYDSYKEKLQVQMSRAFVQQHKGEEWFKERYDPEARASFRLRLSEFRRGAYAQWEGDLEAGTFDEFTLEGIYKNDSNGAGGLAEKEEGEATAANEVLGVGDLLPTRGGEIRDEAAFQPTLLIKTIAPTVSRDKMEEFCKEHLGEGDGGFKWLSLSDPNTQKKCHRIGWVILNPAPDIEMIESKEDERGDGRDEEVDEEGAVRSDAGVEDTKKSASARALEEINGKTIHDEERGDFTCHVGIHEPPAMPRRKALWDLFSAPERIDRDLELAVRLAEKLEEELGSDCAGMARITERVDDLRSKGWLQPPANTAPSKPKKDVGAFDDTDDEGMVEEEEDEGEYDEEVDDEELLAKKKKLDLLVEYMRRVFNFCFFCVFESDSVHELMRKCPGGHLRRPRSSLTSAAKAAARASANGEPFPAKKQEDKQSDDAGDDPIASPVQEKKFQGPKGKSQQQLQRAFNWVKTYEEKLMQILEPETVDIQKLGGKSFDEALEDELNKFVKQEDEAKFRCKVPECTKLFKGEGFWRKHVEKRHEDFFLKIKKDVEMITAYVLDPAHIAPSRSDASSNGHFPLSNAHGHPTGTPRGFNLANMPFNPGFPMNMSPTGMPNPGFQNMFPNGQPLPGSWVNPNALPGTEGDGGHQAGPNRRGGRNFGNRSAGPYDRQGGRDQRNMRWGQAVPGLGSMRFADGAAGAAAGAMGPREAVQGRSLKSYEDLDAAGGSGTGELNY